MRRETKSVLMGVIAGMLAIAIMDAALAEHEFTSARGHALISRLRHAGREGDNAGEGEAIAALRSPEPSVQCAALWTLARVGSPKCIPALLALGGTKAVRDEVVSGARAVAARIRAREHGEARTVPELRRQMLVVLQETGVAVQDAEEVAEGGATTMSSSHEPQPREHRGS